MALPSYPRRLVWPIDATDRHTLARHAQVRLAWIFIHGSKRNADDYHCCALASVPTHEQDLDRTTILILSPRFVDRSDGPVSFVNPPVNCNNSSTINTTTTTTTMSGTSTTASSSGEKAGSTTASDCSTEPLYYAKKGPIAHTWRYGADAAKNPISSYKAIDAMVETIAFDTVRFPNLERIVVAGHSAGGQICHRWALTSMSPAWGDDEHTENATENDATGNATLDSKTLNDSPKKRVVSDSCDCRESTLLCLLGPTSLWHYQ